MLCDGLSPSVCFENGDATEAGGGGQQEEPTLAPGEARSVSWPTCPLDSSSLTLRNPSEFFLTHNTSDAKHVEFSSQTNQSSSSLDTDWVSYNSFHFWH